MSGSNVYVNVCGDLGVVCILAFEKLGQGRGVFNLNYDIFLSLSILRTSHSPPPPAEEKG